MQLRKSSLGGGNMNTFVALWSSPCPTKYLVLLWKKYLLNSVKTQCAKRLPEDNVRYGFSALKVLCNTQDFHGNWQDLVHTFASSVHMSLDNTSFHGNFSEILYFASTRGPPEFWTYFPKALKKKPLGCEILHLHWDVKVKKLSDETVNNSM